MRLARAARKMLRPKYDIEIVPEVPVVPECDVEQLWTERVFVAVADGHTRCAKDAIEWSMLRGGEPDAAKALAPQRPNLTLGWPFRCLAPLAR